MTNRATSTAHREITIYENGEPLTDLDERTRKMIAFHVALDRRVREMHQGRWTFDFGEKDVVPSLNETFGKV